MKLLTGVRDPLLKVDKLTAYVYGVDGSIVQEVELPPIFYFPVRKDVINRAFLSAFTAALQPKGRDPLAGKRTTAKYWGVGYGLSRVPRLPDGTAKFVPFARKGRLAFPPRPDRKIHEEVNKQERVLAIVSALAATARLELVKQRGHIVLVDKLPIIVVGDAERVYSDTKSAKAYLEKIGVWADIERSHEKIRIRAGKGKMRGRKYVEPKSALFILTSYEVPLARAIRNLPGVDIATPNNLSVLHLAPGGVPGRLTIISQPALEQLVKKYEVLYI